MQINRRHFLELAASGCAAAPLGALAAVDPATHVIGTSTSPAPNPDFRADLELELTATVTETAILPGSPTRLWRYRGRVLSGDPNGFGYLPGSDIPVIRVRRGQRLRVYFHNDLPEQSIVHWHGLRIVQAMDGHPMYVIDAGRRFVYEFEVINRAGTYWFHPHPHHRTGLQVYHGLAGLFIVTDEEDEQSGLPAGDQDRAWLIQDRRFNADNQALYAMNHMEMMHGLLGDRMLINGQAEYVEQVTATAYRVRILNGSNSRFYKLAWSDSRPLTLIGTDGGLLESPVEKPWVMLAPAERIELWLDFSSDAPGTVRSLVSLPFEGGTMMMGGGMMGRGGMMQGGTGMANGSRFEVLKVRVTAPGPRPAPLPARLSRIDWPDPAAVINAKSPRVIRLQMGMGRVALNDRTFDMYGYANDEIVKLDSTEIWEFDNSNGMMSHPMHVHNLQFQVVERLRNGRYGNIHRTVSDGLTDEGLKDVVTVMPGERVRVMLHFSRYPGIYLYHCHILEHEDLGMMRNYLIEA